MEVSRDHSYSYNEISPTSLKHSTIKKHDHSSNWDKLKEFASESGLQSPQSNVSIERIVADFIEKDSEIMSDISVDHSLNLSQTMPKSEKKTDEKKRKVKRVDYTLKLTSNDIERNQPTRNTRFKQPMNYKVNIAKTSGSTSKSKAGPGDFNK